MLYDTFISHFRLSDIIIALFFVSILFFIKNLFHELGHVIALILTKKKSKYIGRLRISLLFNYFGTKTCSDLYFHLQDNSTTYKNIIKINAVAGVISEYIFYLLLYIFCYNQVYICDSKYLPVLSSTAFLLIYILGVPSLIMFSDDFKIFRNPVNFKYENYLLVNSRDVLKFVFIIIIIVLPIVFIWNNGVDNIFAIIKINFCITFNFAILISLVLAFISYKLKSIIQKFI